MQKVFFKILIAINSQYKSNILQILITDDDRMEGIWSFKKVLNTNKTETIQINFVAKRNQFLPPKFQSVFEAIRNYLSNYHFRNLSSEMTGEKVLWHWHERDH